MFWTDWGDEPRIERASMDGSERRVLHHTNLLEPIGITVDYQAQKIYWTDISRATIECSNLDGSGRLLLVWGTPIQLQPFSLTIDGNLILWTDGQSSEILATHKLISTGISVLYRNGRGDLLGIEAVNPDRQDQNGMFSLSLSLSLSLSPLSLSLSLSLAACMLSLASYLPSILQLEIHVMGLLVHLCVFRVEQIPLATAVHVPMVMS